MFQELPWIKKQEQNEIKRRWHIVVDPSAMPPCSQVEYQVSVCTGYTVPYTGHSVWSLQQIRAKFNVSSYLIKQAHSVLPSTLSLSISLFSCLSVSLYFALSLSLSLYLTFCLTLFLTLFLSHSILFSYSFPLSVFIFCFEIFLSWFPHCTQARNTFLFIWFL